MQFNYPKYCFYVCIFLCVSSITSKDNALFLLKDVVFLIEEVKFKFMVLFFHIALYKQGDKNVQAVHNISINAYDIYG